MIFLSGVHALSALSRVLVMLGGVPQPRAAPTRLGHRPRPRIRGTLDRYLGGLAGRLPRDEFARQLRGCAALMTWPTIAGAGRPRGPFTTSASACSVPPAELPQPRQPVRGQDISTRATSGHPRARTIDPSSWAARSSGRPASCRRRRAPSTASTRRRIRGDGRRVRASDSCGDGRPEQDRAAR